MSPFFGLMFVLIAVTPSAMMDEVKNDDLQQPVTTKSSSSAAEPFTAPALDSPGPRTKASEDETSSPMIWNYPVPPINRCYKLLRDDGVEGVCHKKHMAAIIAKAEKGKKDASSFDREVCIAVYGYLSCMGNFTCGKCHLRIKDANAYLQELKLFEAGRYDACLRFKVKLSAHDLINGTCPSNGPFNPMPYIIGGIAILLALAAVALIVYCYKNRGAAPAKLPGKNVSRKSSKSKKTSKKESSKSSKSTSKKASSKSPKESSKSSKSTSKKGTSPPSSSSKDGKSQDTSLAASEVSSSSKPKPKSKSKSTKGKTSPPSGDDKSRRETSENEKTERSKSSAN